MNPEIANYAIIATIIILAIIFIIRYRNKKFQPDYFTLFIIGSVWLPLGLIMQNPALWIPGMILLLFSILNIKKWQKNRKSYHEMTINEKRQYKITFILGTIILVIGLIIFYLVNQNII